MVYEMQMTSSDPSLVDQMRRLEESFQHCKEEIEEKWKDMLDETKNTSQNYNDKQHMLILSAKFALIKNNSSL